MTVVIVGAGPSGLYAAMQLRKAGVEHVTIYDPRARIYLRPGHINYSVIERAEHGIGRQLNFPKNKTAHIKDIERLLHQEAHSQQIPIEPKKFIGFSSEEKGIIVANAEGKTEYIPCDYVIDCTGSQRLVTEAMNAVSTSITKPFTTSFITKDVAIKSHLLAYVRMEPRTLKVNDNVRVLPEEIPGSKLEFARNLERLREFGWREFSLPRCYNMPFGKDKVCFYVEAPDNLPSEKKAQWLKTVLESRTGDDFMEFELLPDSKKYEDKARLRLSTFVVNPRELSASSYQEKGRPMVIAQGDVRIEPNYYLAHGIIDSFDRIDKMVKNMDISDGEIKFFHEQKYENDIQPDLKKHRDALIEHYRERKEYLTSWLQKAKECYKYAINATKSSQEKIIFTERLQEVEARIASHNANRLLAQGEFKQALQCFEQALQIQQMIKPKEETAELNLHFNIIRCFCQLQQGEEAILRANEVLTSYPATDTQTKKEIILEVIKATMLQLTSSQKTKKDLVRDVANFYYRNQDLIRQHLREELKDDLSIIISMLGNCNTMLEEAELAVKQGKDYLGLACYQDALLIHRLTSYPSDPQWEENLCTKMIVVYRKLNQIYHVLPFAKDVLNNPNINPDNKKTILFHIIKAGADVIKEVEGGAEALPLVKEIRQLYKKHNEFIKTELQSALKIELQALDSLEQSSEENKNIKQV
ncbi:4-hydroxybenzoate 3-monooxygenase [Legionella lansingensis]|uniref:4-hydroxybenzoate 3-monooxygenase n=1 Tax=Legionella lansingensis TaxID=45067 RepID=A0A0W0VZD4_9GAMM|nr:FAD-dependent monooxygenase [Legionella lansingensis]KTD25407.1 4-hydroxybenzoate 3-monooxygenase [Legionella lansingensis]SNV51382.1 4-hydroxybenzoate 3-monooxygenase [Legionella lansingensis]